ncbi:MAG: tetratricopeptide repeat protein [Saprospiraceae bacterium]
MENRAEHLLESYFANALTAAEAIELKTLVSADPTVATDLAFQKRVAATLQSRSLADGIQNPAWKMAAQKPTPSAAIKVSMFPKYAYAAAAAIALLIFAYIFIMPPSLQSVVADNTKEYPNKMKFKSFGEDAVAVPETVIKAFELYDNQEYSAAAKALQPIVTSNADRMDYRLYWAVSLVKSKQYPAAVTALTPLAQSQDERRIPALYYLGLACAGVGDKDCARQNLQDFIASPESVSFRKEAEAVLNAL